MMDNQSCEFVKFIVVRNLGTYEEVIQKVRLFVIISFVKHF